MPMTPYGKTNGLGGYNSGDVDWQAFYNNMGPGQNNTLGGTPYGNSGWGASRSYPMSVPGTANGTMIANKDQSRFPTENPLQAQLLAYSGQQPGNPAAVAAAAQANGTPYNNPGWGARRSLPPLPNAVSATMQRNGGLSLPFFTPKTEQALQAKPDLGALLGSLFKSTPKPKQLPMPAALPRTYGGTAEAFRGAQARDRLTAPKGGSTYQESQDRLSTLYNR